MTDAKRLKLGDGSVKDRSVDDEVEVVRGMASIRWAFRCGSWRPTQEEWMLAARCIQNEEKKRIGKFVFKKDAKSAMCGRLLMRRVIAQCLDIPHDEIKLARTEKGKPYLTNDVPEKFASFNFNVSHQGNYAVLAAEPLHHVGVDVMQVEYPRGSGGTKRFFDTMKRQFTSQEWKVIKDPKEEYDQISRFYRLWCLKESYVKALGIGIGFDLQRLSFQPRTLKLNPGMVALDTIVLVDGKEQHDWSFQESMLDANHYVAVALKQRENLSENSPEVNVKELPSCSTTLFKTLTFDQLMEGAKPLRAPDSVYWSSFNSKMERPGVK